MPKVKPPNAQPSSPAVLISPPTRPISAGGRVDHQLLQRRLQDQRVKAEIGRVERPAGPYDKEHQPLIARNAPRKAQAGIDRGTCLHVSSSLIRSAAIRPGNWSPRAVADRTKGVNRPGLSSDRRRAGRASPVSRRSRHRLVAFRSSARDRGGCAALPSMLGTARIPRGAAAPTAPLRRNPPMQHCTRPASAGALTGDRFPLASEATGVSGLAERYAAALFDLADERHELDAVAGRSARAARDAGAERRPDPPVAQPGAVARGAGQGDRGAEPKRPG